MNDKQKTPLTFAIYQNDALVRRETVHQDVVKIGRDARSHLRLEDEQAGRMHAVIEVTSPDDLTLLDLGNEPRTSVNGARVDKCKIRVGDQIQIGATKIVLEKAGDVAVAAASTAAGPTAATLAPNPAFGGPAAPASPVGSEAADDLLSESERCTLLEERAQAAFLLTRAQLATESPEARHTFDVAMEALVELLRLDLTKAAAAAERAIAVFDCDAAGADQLQMTLCTLAMRFAPGPPEAARLAARAAALMTRLGDLDAARERRSLALFLDPGAVSTDELLDPRRLVREILGANRNDLGRLTPVEDLGRGFIGAACLAGQARKVGNEALARAITVRALPDARWFDEVFPAAGAAFIRAIHVAIHAVELTEVFGEIGEHAESNLPLEASWVTGPDDEEASVSQAQLLGLMTHPVPLATIRLGGMTYSSFAEIEGRLVWLGKMRTPGFERPLFELACARYGEGFTPGPIIDEACLEAWMRHMVHAATSDPARRAPPRGTYERDGAFHGVVEQVRSKRIDGVEPLRDALLRAALADETSGRALAALAARLIAAALDGRRSFPETSLRSPMPELLGLVGALRLAGGSEALTAEIHALITLGDAWFSGHFPPAGARFLAFVYRAAMLPKLRVQLRNFVADLERRPAGLGLALYPPDEPSGDVDDDDDGRGPPQKALMKAATAPFRVVVAGGDGEQTFVLVDGRLRWFGFDGRKVCDLAALACRHGDGYELDTQADPHAQLDAWRAHIEARAAAGPALV